MTCPQLKNKRKEMTNTEIELFTKDFLSLGEHL